MTFSHQLNDTGSKILPHEKEKKSVVFYHFYSSSETLRQLCLIENQTDMNSRMYQEHFINTTFVEATRGS